MDSEHDTQLLKSYRKKPLFDLHALEAHPLDRADIEGLLPHRAPILFVDAITHWNRTEQQIVGFRHIRADDPIFSGHFPNNPVYPGCLVMESIGQLALCLYQLSRGERHTPVPAGQIDMYLTRIVGALFLRPILPGITMHSLAMALPQNGMYHRAMGQALDGNGEVAAVMIAEMLID